MQKRKLTRMTTFLLATLVAISSAGAQTPQVVSISPGENSTGIMLNANLEVRFNIEMDSMSFTNSTFVVRGQYSGIHEGTFDYDTLTRTITYDPLGDFAFGEFVNVTLTAGIASESGTQLAPAYHWSFYTNVLGEAGPYSDVTHYETELSTRSVCAGDFDEDGDLDLAVSSLYLPTDISILLNNGNGTFGAASKYAHCGMLEHVIAADLNADGHVDLAAVSAAFDSLVIMLGNGSGAFASYTTAGVGTGPFGLTAADLDGDGDPDVVTADHHADQLTVLYNNGNGAFPTKLTLTAGNEPMRVVAADFDGDNDIDLASANVTSDDVSVFLNNGGSFSPQSRFDVGNGPWGICAADFDGDGDVDLATGDYESTDVYILKNNGSGSFSGGTVYPSGTLVGVSALTPADLDGDNDIDLAVTGLGSITMYVMLNNGSGSFSVAASASTEALTSYVVAADLDSDGDLDLATANESGPSVTVAINSSALASVDDTPLELPESFYLKQNFPNPFNPTTSITYSLETTADVSLRIYNSLGQVVRTLDSGVQQAGFHRVIWDGCDAAGNRLSSGVYFYQLSAGDYSHTRKMIMLK